MPSQARHSYSLAAQQRDVLYGLASSTAPFFSTADETEQSCLKASVACGVGCWEGYIENVLREFVLKTKTGITKRPWQLISQFEYVVQRLTDDLNTPSWEKVRELVHTITGIDPTPAWSCTPLFANTQSAKDFFDGLMKVRHSFAHGFNVPHGIPHLVTQGKLDGGYVATCSSLIDNLVFRTDALLEHELIHRHNCSNGW
jgi:hypothetical protein